MKAVFVFFLSLRAELLGENNDFYSHVESLFFDEKPIYGFKTKLDKIPEQIIARIEDGLNTELPYHWYNFHGGSKSQKNDVYLMEANDIFDEIKSDYFPGLISNDTYDYMFSIIRGKAHNAVTSTTDLDQQIKAAVPELEKVFEISLVENLQKWGDYLGRGLNDKLKRGHLMTPYWEHKRDYQRSLIGTTTKLVNIIFGSEEGYLLERRVPRDSRESRITASQELTDNLSIRNLLEYHDEPRVHRTIIASQKLTNNLPNSQTLIMSASFAETQTTRITTGVSLTFEVSPSFIIYVAPGGEEFRYLIDSKIESAYTEMNKRTTSNTKSLSDIFAKSETKTYEFPLTAPPNMAVLGEVSVTEEDIQMSFRQKFDVNGYPYTVKGVWEGIKRASLNFDVKKNTEDTLSPFGGYFGK